MAIPVGLKVLVFFQFGRSCCAQQHVGFNDRFKSPLLPSRARHLAARKKLNHEDGKVARSDPIDLLVPI